jgi:hypothetical protein
VSLATASMRSLTKIRHEQEQAAACRREPTRPQRKLPHVGHCLDGRPRTIGALFVQPSGQRGKPFGLQHLSDGRWAQRPLLVLLSKGWQQGRGLKGMFGAFRNITVKRRVLGRVGQVRPIVCRIELWARFVKP